MARPHPRVRLTNLTVFSAACLFTLALGACSGGENRAYRAPSISGNPSGMSAQTLCFRYVNGKRTEAMAAEIEARRLDCADILENDPLAPPRF